MAKTDGKTKSGSDASPRPTSRRRPAPPAEPCETCGRDLTNIAMSVDGTELVMQSCDFCDRRTWTLGNQQIDLAEALEHVGENKVRRRS